MSDGAELALGQQVTFTRHLERRSVDDGRRLTFTKRWVSEQWPGQPEPKPRAGVVVGIRWVSNGDVTFAGYEDPATYTATETFKAYLIAYNVRRSPVLVLPEHVRPAFDQTQIEALA